MQSLHFIFIYFFGIQFCDNIFYFFLKNTFIAFNTREEDKKMVKFIIRNEINNFIFNLQ